MIENLDISTECAYCGTDVGDIDATECPNCGAMDWDMEEDNLVEEIY